MKPGEIGVLGVGCTPMLRKAPDLEHEMLLDALAAALEDADLSLADVDGLIFASPYQQYCKQLYFPSFILNHIRKPLSVPLVETMGNGMTGESALRIAMDQVLLGRGRIVVALGVSKWSLAPAAAHFDITMRAVGDVDYEVPAGLMPLSWYAMDAQRYMHLYGVTREQLAAVAVKNRKHAQLNPIAQVTKPLSIEDVVTSRPIVEPLHLLDICPRSDGACAVVIGDRAVFNKRSVPILSTAFAHDGSMSIDDLDLGETVRLVAARRACEQAYREVGIRPGEVDFAEIYAPTTSVEVMVSEALGFFADGQGAEAAASGATAVGGSIPISPSGGLLSRGHPPRVTPLYSVLEAVIQLRHEAGDRQVEGCSVGLTTTEMGRYNGCNVTILGAPGSA
jgi:acetyl-CoA C-acetyltransferase